MVTNWIALGLVACLAGLTGGEQTRGAQPQPMRAEDLTLEKLYRNRSYAGQQARGAAFSHQGRYLAYTWNPYGENGSDLYIHDTRDGQTKRVTSLELMKQYDPPETTEHFLKKAQDREKQLAEAQEIIDAQAAYLLGANIDLDKWDLAAIEKLKKEADEKKAKADAEKQSAEVDAGSTSSGQGRQQQEREKELWEWRDELKQRR